MTENNYNKRIDAICELVNLAYDATTSKEEFERLDNAGAEVIDCLEKLQKFEEIGTVEELEVLKEKNETLKALYEDARKEGNNLLARARNNVIDEFANTLIQRLTDAIYQKDVESMINLINDVARELKGRWQECD